MSYKIQKISSAQSNIYKIKHFEKWLFQVWLLVIKNL